MTMRLLADILVAFLLMIVLALLASSIGNIPSGVEVVAYLIAATAVLAVRHRRRQERSVSLG